MPLARALDAEPLPEEHGAPLRLVIRLEGGVRGLERPGTPDSTAVRPAHRRIEPGTTLTLDARAAGPG